jgi:cell division control protein 6
MSRKGPDRTIMMNDQVLEETFIPSTLLHRENQMERLMSCLANRPFINAMLYGGPGIGKTATVMRAFRDLEVHDSKTKLIYVNCWEHPTRFDILFEVASRVYPMLIRRGTSSSELLERIREYRDRTGEELIVCLDEVDQMRESEVLYNLLSLKCGLILISKDKRVLQSLKVNDRIRSRIGLLLEIEFPAYSTSELYNIIKQRVRQAFRPESIGDYQIAEIAARVGQRNSGDARIALLTLKKTAMLAAREGKSKIENVHIEKAWGQANHLFMSRIWPKLSPDKRVLFGIVEEHGEIGTGELYETYRARIERQGRKPVEQVTCRKYMQEMARSGIVKAVGKGRWRRYRIA